MCRPVGFHGNVPFKSLCCCCALKNCLVDGYWPGPQRFLQMFDPPWCPLWYQREELMVPFGCKMHCRYCSELGLGWILQFRDPCSVPRVEILEPSWRGAWDSLKSQLLSGAFLIYLTLCQDRPQRWFPVTASKRQLWHDVCNLLKRFDLLTGCRVTDCDWCHSWSEICAW